MTCIAKKKNTVQVKYRVVYIAHCDPDPMDSNVLHTARLKKKIGIRAMSAVHASRGQAACREGMLR